MAFFASSPRAGRAPHVATSAGSDGLGGPLVASDAGISLLPVGSTPAPDGAGASDVAAGGGLVTGAADGALVCASGGGTSLHNRQPVAEAGDVGMASPQRQGVTLASPPHAVAAVRTLGARRREARLSLPLASPTGMVSGSDWRGSAALKVSHFLCTNCMVGSPYAALGSTSGACLKCGSTVSSAPRGGSTAESRALQAVASTTAKGRSYRFLQDRDQTLGPGVGVHYEDPGYTAAVLATIHGGRAADGRGRLEAVPRNGVILFDSWLCVKTAGRLRVYTNADMKAFVCAPMAEALLVDFIMALSRVITVVGADGTLCQKQACRSTWLGLVG